MSLSTGKQCVAISGKLYTMVSIVSILSTNDACMFGACFGLSANMALSGGQFWGHFQQVSQLGERQAMWCCMARMFA